MHPHLKLYLKPFLVAGLSFGALIGIWDYIDNGTVSWIKIVFMTVTFGALTTWREVASQKKKVKPKK